MHSRRCPGSATIAAALVAAATSTPVAAQTGLLHKHGHRAAGIPVTLPGPAAGAIAPAVPPGGDALPSPPVALPVVVAPGAATEGKAIAPLPIDGTAIDPGGLVDLPVCVMPLPGHADGGKPLPLHPLPGAVPGHPGDVVDPGVVTILPFPFEGGGFEGPITADAVTATIVPAAAFLPEHARGVGEAFQAEKV